MLQDRVVIVTGAGRGLGRAMALTARALCALLEDDPLCYTGRVLSVRDYLHEKDL